MRPYRVLHLITHLGVGGAQDYMLHAVRNLDRSQFEVHIATGKDELDWLARAQEWSDELHLVCHLRRSIILKQDFVAVQEIVRLLKQGHYDIIHTHSSKAGALGRLAAWIARVPAIVHTIHGLPWHQYRMSAQTERLYKGIELISALYSDRVLTVCTSNSDELTGEHIVSAKKLATIYNGIDSAYLDVTVDRKAKCMELGLDPSLPIVGMVGRLAEPKAPLDFVKAAAMAADQRSSVQFIIVGDGPLRSMVEAAVATIPQIRLLGMRADVPAILKVLDVFAASSIREGLSRAVAEALLAKVPVAVTAVNGTPELVIHGVTGLLSPAHRPDLLAENIIRLINEPTLAQRLATQGYEHVKNMCSITTMVQQLERLYSELLEMNNQK